MLIRPVRGRLAVVVFGWLVAMPLFALPVAAAPASPSTLPSGEDLAAGQASAALMSHSADYDMNLASSRHSSGVVGAKGSMHYTFTDTCDGWTVETRTVLDLVPAQGEPSQTTWDFLSWESKDGKRYTFRVRSSREAEVTETYSGEARMGENGAAGSAVFRQGDEGDQVFDLPAGTLFPTAHTLDLIRKARKGGRFFSAPVFDGSAVKGAFQVTAVIGQMVGPDVSPELPGEALLGLPSWPMALAFFDLDSKGDTPDFEVHLRYHENGVAEGILQDFGDFALRGTLKGIQSIKKPGC